MYTLEFPSQRIDGIGLYARLGFMLDQSGIDLNHRYAGISLPYHSIGGGNRINIGSPSEKAKLTIAQADLLVGRQAVHTAVACFTLRDFRTGAMKLPMGRPVSFGATDASGRPIKRTDYGSPLHTNEQFQAMTLIADGATGEMSLLGQPWQEDSWVALEKGQSSAAEDFEHDKFRFGVACMTAMARTSVAPEVKVLQVA